MVVIKLDLNMKIAIFFLLFASSTVMASETFHAHERFKSPTKIPSSVLTQLTKEIGKEGIRLRWATGGFSDCQ